MDCSMPGFDILHYLWKFAQTPVHWVNDAIQTSRPLSPPSPPALNLPSIRVFSNESALCIRWPKYQSFSFSISASNECSELISFRVDVLIDCFDLLAVQGTLKSVPASQLKSINSLAFSLLCGPALTSSGKTIALTGLTFVGKVMSQLFNTLSRFVIVFLPRNKCLLVLWLQSSATEILESKKIKSVIVSISPIYLPWSDGAICHDLSFLNVEFRPAFSLSSFTFIKRLFSFSSLSAMRVVSSA